MGAAQGRASDLVSRRLQPDCTHPACHQALGSPSLPGPRPPVAMASGPGRICSVSRCCLCRGISISICCPGPLAGDTSRPRCASLHSSASPKCLAGLGALACYCCCLRPGACRGSALCDLPCMPATCTLACYAPRFLGTCPAGKAPSHMAACWLEHSASLSAGACGGPPARTPPRRAARGACPCSAPPSWSSQPCTTGRRCAGSCCNLCSSWVRVQRRAVPLVGMLESTVVSRGEHVCCMV